MVAIIPVKGMATAKSRLAETLSADERQDLVLSMLRNVIAAARDAGLDPCVVSPDREVRRFAQRCGATTIDDGGADLSGAVAFALRRYADRDGIVVVAADLPYITGGDLRRLIDGAEPLAVVAAADGTTNAVAAFPPSAFVPSYGPGSARRHGGRRLRIRGLQLDLDTPADLEQWLAVAG